MSGATVIQIELLSGRYHAHVWGEAQFGMAGPEWPPSPWRLLRALTSAWFCARPHPSSAADRDGLLEALGRSGAPGMWLPRTSVHEVRYYQPVHLGVSDSVLHHRVLHHDHFAVPEGGRFWFRFEAALHPDQRALLADLLARLRYFGRSESRAHLRLVELNEPPNGVFCVAPRNARRTSPRMYRRVLCPTPDFRASNLWSIRRGEVEPSENGYPTHLVDALLGKRMPLPRGTKWVEYPIPAPALVHEIRRRVSTTCVAPDVDVAEIRFRLNCRAPIPLRCLVAVARAFRDAAVEALKIRNGQRSRMLSGREASGEVALGHRHVYYLPRLRPEGVMIEEFLVRVPGGRLTRLELDALLEVSRIRAGGSRYPITVLPEAVVAVAEPATPACRWRSATPFLPPLRHRRGKDETSVDQQAITCVERLCGKRPISVYRVPGPGGLGSASALLAHEYGGSRGRGWSLTRRVGFWLELTFDEPVMLNNAFGADAHFGVGQFVPCYERETQ